MATAIRKVVGSIGALIVLALFVAGFVAYFIYEADPDSGVMYDGFGRALSPSPWLIRWVFGHDRLWPGWAWFVADMVIFWGGLLVGAGLTMWGWKPENDND